MSSLSFVAKYWLGERKLMAYGIEVFHILCWTKPTGCLMLVSRMIFAGLSHTHLATRKVDKLSCVSFPCPLSTK